MTKICRDAVLQNCIDCQYSFFNNESLECQAMSMVETEGTFSVVKKFGIHPDCPLQDCEVVENKDYNIVCFTEPDGYGFKTRDDEYKAVINLDYKYTEIDKIIIIKKGGRG